MPCRMLKKAASKATASEEARRTLRYVEPLSAARTKLTPDKTQRECSSISEAVAGHGIALHNPSQRTNSFTRPQRSRSELRQKEAF